MSQSKSQVSYNILVRASLSIFNRLGPFFKKTYHNTVITPTKLIIPLYSLMPGPYSVAFNYLKNVCVFKKLVISNQDLLPPQIYIFYLADMTLFFDLPSPHAPRLIYPVEFPTFGDCDFFGII